MENYKNILQTMLSNSEPLAENLSEQEYIEMQIKANRMVYSLDCEELEKLNKQIENFESWIEGYEERVKYYVTHNFQDTESEQNIKDLTIKLTRAKGAKLSLLDYIKKLEEEYNELTQSLFMLKQEIEPHLRLLRDALDAYLGGGMQSNQVAEGQSAYDESQIQPQIEDFEQESQPFSE